MDSELEVSVVESGDAKVVKEYLSSDAVQIIVHRAVKLVADAMSFVISELCEEVELLKMENKNLSAKIYSIGIFKAANWVYLLIVFSSAKSSLRNGCKLFIWTNSIDFNTSKIFISSIPTLYLITCTVSIHAH